MKFIKHIPLLAVALAASMSTVIGMQFGGPISATAGSGGGLYEPVAPFRVFDSRIPAQGTSRAISVASPSGATAVAVNITMAGNGERGYMTAWSGVGAAPGTSIINAASALDAVANFAIVPLGPGGTIKLWSITDTRAVVDVMGYVISGTTSTLNGQVTATITGYTEYFGDETQVIGTITNGTTEHDGFRIEVICPGGELETDLAYADSGDTVAWDVRCDGIHTSGATVRGVVKL